MDSNGDVEAKTSKESNANRRVCSMSAFLEKLALRVRSARDNIEDSYLRCVIPEAIARNLTFYRLHVMYFLLTAIWGTIILYIAHRSDTGERKFTFVDSIFNVVSVVTVTGLMSVRIADLSTFDKILFLILMTLGSPAFTSLIPLCVRRFYFFKHHRLLMKEQMKETGSSNASTLETPKLGVTSANPGPDDNEVVWRNWDARSTFATAPQFSSKPLFIASPGHSLGNDGRQSHQLSLDLTVDIVRAFNRPQSRFDKLDRREMQVLGQRKNTSSAEDVQPYGSVNPWQETCPSPLNLMRTFEHQSLVVLSWLVPLYIVVTQLAGVGLNMIIFAFSPYSVKLLKERQLNTLFFCVFTVISSFSNSGVPANDDNLVPFQKEYVLLMFYTSASLMGNLLYPAFLRLIISFLGYVASDSRKPVYNYLLDHPRRCFTHLFPHKQTVWLGITVIGFTVVQLIFFCSLEWSQESLEGLNPIEKIVDGIYQSVSARNAGGDVVDIAELTSAMLVLYVFMMFIASYPVAMLRQNSAVHEYKDIGIYDKRWEEELTDNSLMFQSRKLLAKDSAYLCIILFLVCIIERKNIDVDPLNYSIFNIIFEIVSAYGGVGMSVGYNCNLRLAQFQPNQELAPCTDVPYSLSGKWSTAGKIILAIVMFMGRHRGLPDDIDSAIKLPDFNETPVGNGGGSPESHGGRSFAQSSQAKTGPFKGESLDKTSEGSQPTTVASS